MKRTFIAVYLLSAFTLSPAVFAKDACAPFDVNKCQKGQVIHTSLDDSLKYCDLDKTKLTGDNEVKCLYIGYDRSQDKQ